MFDLLWSDDLLDEIERVLTDKKGLSTLAARYFCQCIREAFPEGRIEPESYRPLVASRIGPDPDDHVHSAAAVAGGATIVLSADKTGYPVRDIAPARRRNPDAFLTDLLRRHPQDVLSVVDEMGQSLRSPLTRDEVLARLGAAGAPGFASAASEWG